LHINNGKPDNWIVNVEGSIFHSLVVMDSIFTKIMVKRDKKMKPNSIIKLFIVTTISAMAFSTFIAASGSNEPKNHAGEIRYTEIWTSPDNSLVLYGGETKKGHMVCPWIATSENQPFCRNFTSPMRGACGSGEKVFIVLADGAIHLVNNTLIGSNNDFKPIFQPRITLNLEDVWLAESGCSSDSGIPEALAIRSDGSMVRFDGSAWKVVVLNGGVQDD
jgi:hypothetical protein